MTTATTVTIAIIPMIGAVVQATVLLFVFAAIMDKTLGEQQKKMFNENPILTSHFAFVKSPAPTHTSHTHAHGPMCQ